MITDWREVLAREETLDLHAEQARATGHRWCKIDPPPSELTDTLIAHGWQLQPDSPRPANLQHGELAGQHWRHAGLAALLYDGSYLQRRRTTRCSNTHCNCFIGYIQRTDLPQLRTLAQGALERVWDRNEVIP